jgi:hypothetical protein
MPGSGSIFRSPFVSPAVGRQVPGSVTTLAASVSGWKVLHLIGWAIDEARPRIARTGTDWIVA